jgi:hypothetical protein
VSRAHLLSQESTRRRPDLLAPGAALCSPVGTSPSALTDETRRELDALIRTM